MGGGDVVGAGENRFGRLSELRLVAERRGRRTEPTDLYSSMPFRVMRPFWPDELGEKGAGGPACPPGLMRVMVMSVSAGIMAGDEQRVDVTVRDGAAAEVTSQAFEKVHRMEGEGSARRVTRLRVEGDGFLRYSLLPTIPFAGSDFTTDLTADLEGPTSRLIITELVSAGRVARGERFDFRRYRSRVVVRCGGVPVYVDNLLLSPSPVGVLPGMDLDSMGFFEGFTHLANLVLVNMGVSDDRLQAVRDYLGGLREQAAPGSAAEVAGGVTRLESGDFVVRLLGRNAQSLQRILSHLEKGTG